MGTTIRGGGTCDNLGGGGEIKIGKIGIVDKFLECHIAMYAFTSSKKNLMKVNMRNYNNFLPMIIN